MSEAKHTPGPWSVTGHGAGEGMISHQTGHVAFTAFPWNVEESRDDGESWIDMRERTQPDRSKLRAEKLANAHLIAAAPEMLATLRKLEYWLDTDPEVIEAMPGDERRDHIAKLGMIREVIAKAEGKQ